MKTKQDTQVILAMFRYNPQLGSYCTLKLANVVKAYKKTMLVSDGYYERKFDFFGNEVKPTSAVYGSAHYRVFALELAKELYDASKGTFDGYRISRGQNVVETL